MRLSAICAAGFLLLNALNAQHKPDNYFLKTEKTSIGKIASETPAANSINDILVNGDTIWLATSRGLSRSTDKGFSWKNYYEQTPFGTESVTALAYDPSTKSLWAATAHSTEQLGQTLPEGSGVHFTTDGGSTWKSVPQPLDGASDTTEVYGINTLRALPVTVKVQNIIYDIAITPNVVWVATFAGGLRKNRIDSLFVNQSHPWKRVVLPPDLKTKISPSDSLYFCLSPVAGKYCGDNNYNYRVFSLATADDSTIFVGTAAGINKTTQANKAAGSNDMVWERLEFSNSNDNTLSGNFVTALDYNTATKTVWAATWKANGANEFYGVSFSSDKGATWNRTLFNEKVHNFGQFKNLTIATSDNGPQRTYDLGNTWSLPGTIVDSVTGLALRTKTFYSAAFSHDGSGLWLGSDDGLMYQAGLSSGWGKNWRIFFASTPLPSKSETYGYPSPFSPRSEICKIKYSTGDKTANVTIRIFSTDMKYIRTVVQNAPRGSSYNQINQPAGGINGVIDFWDGRDDSGSIVPNGVYFYRIDIDSADPLFGKVMVLQ